MVDSIPKILSLVLFLALISQGYGQCSLGSVYNRQSVTGRIVKEQKEWNVQIINNCKCPVKNVILNCTEFQTSEPVKPPVFSTIGGNYFCLVNNGDSINPGIQGMVTFQYAWNHQCPFTPISFDVACS